MVLKETKSCDLGNINAAFEDHEGVIQNGIKDDKSETEEIKQKRPHPHRVNWDNRVEFLLSCVAMSVGLGNVWRFPFTAYENGGGAFLIPYIIVSIFIGNPLYYMELCMGQFSSKGPVKAWDMAPGLRGIGIGQMIASWMVATYYMYQICLSTFYFFSSFTSVLPWAECPVNARECIDGATNISGININTSISAAERYFQKVVTKKDPSGFDRYTIDAPDLKLSMCLLFCWFLLFLMLRNGVKSWGKIAYFTALFPYVVLFVLLGRAVALPGALRGIKYFFYPQWEKLLKPHVWYAALTQSFFSLNVGFGTITMYSSYNKFRHDVYMDSSILSAVDTFTSLLSGITFFSVLGYLAELMQVDDVGLVVKGRGSALAFVSFPDVLARFNWVLPQLFAVPFFLMLIALGIGTALGLVGSLVTTVLDERPHYNRTLVTFIVCISGFFPGLFYTTPQGLYALDLVDYYGGTFVVYILAMVETIVVQWVYGYKNFERDIEFMLGRTTGVYWRFCWTIFIPVHLYFIFVYLIAIPEPLKSGSYIFGGGARVFGNVITLVAIGVIPLIFGITLYKNWRRNPNLSEALHRSLEPSAKWGPVDPLLKKQYREFIEEKESMSLKEIDDLEEDTNSELESIGKHITVVNVRNSLSI